MSVLLVFTTLPSRDSARALARQLVERHLAACAQITEIESFYPWDGAIQNDGEFRVLLKTTGEHYAAVEQAIRELHPYELPAIHAVPAAEVHGPYAQWIAEWCAGR